MDELSEFEGRRRSSWDVLPTTQRWYSSPRRWAYQGPLALVHVSDLAASVSLTSFYPVRDETMSSFIIHIEFGSETRCRRWREHGALQSRRSYERSAPATPQTLVSMTVCTCTQPAAQPVFVIQERGCGAGPLFAARARGDGCGCSVRS